MEGYIEEGWNSEFVRQIEFEGERAFLAIQVERAKEEEKDIEV